MIDLISRQDAINILRHHLDEDYLDGYVYWNELKDIPSAEPERKTGKWIYDTERVRNDGGVYAQYHCSECNYQIFGGLSNYCPNCGVGMTRGE